MGSAASSIKYFYLCSVTKRVHRKVYVGASTVCSEGTPSTDNANTRFHENRCEKWENFLDVQLSLRKFLDQKSIPVDASDSLFELRLYLDNSDLLKLLIDFAKGSPWLSVIVCWADIQQFVTMKPECRSQQYCCATIIFEKYVKSNFALSLEGGENMSNIITEMKSVLKNADSGNKPLPSDMFRNFQLKCLLCIHNRVWQDFEYQAPYFRISNILEGSNSLAADNFVYKNLLGNGGYGVVILAEKKSTGKHYAIKVQSKTMLLNCYSDCMHRATSEREALVLLNHPFIVTLDMAFQTDAYVMAALELGTCGTLKNSMYSNKQTPEPIVRFYAAQIALALFHIHSKGFIYRDLKPSNILLMADGNIKLIDLGGVIYKHDGLCKPLTTHANTPKGSSSSTVLSMFKSLDPEVQSINTDFSELCERLTDCSCDERLSDSYAGSVRATSVTGTTGYMAPEMLSMLDEDYDLYPEGYSQCVDWWSFGVTVMELLSGFNPMKHVDLTPSFGSDKSSHHLPLPNNMFDNALDKFCNYETISFAAKHMVRQFLALDASCRLGAGRTGVDRIKNHMFFQCIDWDQLEQGHVMPPYFPEVKVAEAMQHSSFEKAIEFLNKKVPKFRSKANRKPIDEDDNKEFFGKWNYLSRSTIELSVKQYVDSL